MVTNRATNEKTAILWISLQWRGRFSQSRRRGGEGASQIVCCVCGYFFNGLSHRPLPIPPVCVAAPPVGFAMPIDSLNIIKFQSTPLHRCLRNSIAGFSVFVNECSFLISPLDMKHLLFPSQRVFCNFIIQQSKNVSSNYFYSFTICSFMLD